MTRYTDAQMTNAAVELITDPESAQAQCEIVIDQILAGDEKAVHAWDRPLIAQIACLDATGQWHRFDGHEPNDGDGRQHRGQGVIDVHRELQSMAKDFSKA